MAFKPGRSGNPKGRPKGRPDRRAQWREALARHGDDLVAKAVELALSGDTQALKLCIDRAIPAYRPAAEPVAFELTGDTLTEKADSVIDAIAGGHIDPMTGKALIDALAALASIVSTDEYERRLAAIEEQTKR